MKFTIIRHVFFCLFVTLYGGVFIKTVYGQGYPPECVKSATYPFLTQHESKTFLRTRHRRQVTCVGYTVGPSLALDCNHETICECNKPLCSTETDREIYCQGTACLPNQICFLLVPCWVHYAVACSDDQCLSYPCVHGTCVDGDGDYTCVCTAGYEGRNCETEIDECESNPCQNGGTCTEAIDIYWCSCTEDFTGLNCETDMCKPQFPTGADVVFLLDSSMSQNTSNFQRQLQYVKDFVKEFPIGATDFQIAVVTASTEANVHFYLNNYTAEAAMLNAIDDVIAEGGASYTGRGLETIREDVLLETNGARPLVPKYTLVLTDGLSSNADHTQEQAALLRQFGVEIISIAIGQQVLHEQLLDMASHWTKVFPAVNKDAANVILKKHVMEECPDCHHSTSDVLFLIDSSANVQWAKYTDQLKAVQTLINRIPVGVDDVHISLVNFAKDAERVCDFDEYFTVTDLLIELNTMSRLAGEVNITIALQYARLAGFSATSGARTETRKFAILVTSSEFPLDTTDMVFEAEELKKGGVTLVTVAIDAETIQPFLAMASDPAYVYVLGNDIHIPFSSLYSLVGSMDYDVCEMD